MGISRLWHGRDAGGEGESRIDRGSAIVHLGEIVQQALGEDFEQKTFQVVSDVGRYDMTATLDDRTNSLYLGVELSPPMKINEMMAKDLLIENGKLSNAKIYLAQAEDADEFRIVASTEVSIPSFTRSRLEEAILSLDAAVGEEYNQIGRLADKHGLVIPEIPGLGDPRGVLSAPEQSD